MEGWKGGILGKTKTGHPFLLTHYSIIPMFHYSSILASILEGGRHGISG
jgi:hypothetical protein